MCFSLKYHNQIPNHHMLSLPVLLNIINNKILNDYNTKLVGGFDEPFYKAFKQGDMAEIQFTQDYIRSALHELSHWCVAGVERRKIDDYGYWYAEDGRNQQQQDEFFKVEIKPQAIEWAFSIVSGVKFEASVDNLGCSVKGVEEFNNQLNLQLNKYLKTGFNSRVFRILRVIGNENNIKDPLIFIQNHIKA